MSNGIETQINLPNDWQWIPIYELRNKSDKYSFTGGPFGSDLKSEDYTESGVRIIQLQNIGEGKFLEKSKIYTSESKADALISCNIYPGEIILAKMAPVARCCKIPPSSGRYLMCSDGIRLSINRKRFDNEFIYQALNADYFRNDAESKSTGTTRSRIGLNDLKLIPIAVPNSIAEQQKIAEILSAVDDKMAVIDEQLAKTAELKTGLMQRLLTKGISHTKFKDSPLGEIPESWEVVQIKTLADVTSSKRILQSEYVESGIPFYRSKEVIIKSRRRKLGDLVYISQDRFDELSRKFGAPQKGDILITAVGTIGITYLVDEDEPFYFKDGNLMWLRKINPVIDSCFLNYFLASEIFQKVISGTMNGSNQMALTIDKFANLKLPLPSIAEQRLIAELLLTVDEKIQVLRDKKEHYQTLKRGLMQQLLIGKLRVRVTEDAVAA